MKKSFFDRFDREHFDHPLGGFLIVLGAMVIAIIFGIVSIGIFEMAWPAENTVQEKEDYVAIMEQAENWPIKGGDIKDGILEQLHQDLQNSDRFMLSFWFINKNKHPDELDVFAKILFLESNQKSGKLDKPLAIMLKNQGGSWEVGDYLVRSEALYNGEKGLVFSLYHQSIYNLRGRRIFLLKDLIPPKK